MDPISVVVGALAAGAAAGAQDTASASVKDAYAALKSLLKQRLRGRPAADTALEQHEEEPDAWRPALARELAKAGIDRDAEVLEAARRLETALDSIPGGRDRYIIDARWASQTQIGPGNTQFNLGRERPGDAPRRR